MNEQVQTFTFENMIAMVHSPVLTAEEKEKRMKKIYNASVRLLTDAERARAKK